MSSQGQQERDSYVRLFDYIQAVGRIIGEEKAWRILDDLNTERRLAWYRQHKDLLSLEGSVVERGFQAFLLEYVGTSPEEHEIVEKSPTRIVYRSYNYCPTLEACRILGLDTRKVCRLAYERPAQAFLAQIDPRLVFRRNYEQIRPYTPYCEEIIEMREEASE